ncbi:MAG: hypothetical protein R3F56_24640 [Planctomycetota bacterium]
MPLLRTLLVVAAVSSSLACRAQRTWVVDAAGGAGVDFTDLPPAFAAVADGDRVVVRRGTYTPGTLTHAIQLVGQPGAAMSFRNASPFLVRGIPAGRTCSIEGFTLTDVPFSQNHLRFENCAGIVAVQSVVVLPATFPALSPAHFSYVSDCAGVSFHACTLEGGLGALRSRVTASGCTLNGPNAVITAPSTLMTTDTEVDLTLCSVRGLDGTPEFVGSAAATLVRSRLTARSGTQMIAGTPLFSGPLPSIDGTFTSDVTVDPSVVLTPAPQHLVALVVTPLPALTAPRVPIGSTLPLSLASPVNDLYAIFAALPAPPFSMLWGEVWLDVPTSVFLATGVQTGGLTTVWLPIPPNPELEGAALAFQALSGSALAGTRLSNPLLYVFRP